MKKLKYTVGFLLVMTTAALAEDTTWHLLIEPSFLHDPVSWPIAKLSAAPDGSPNTGENSSVVLVPAKLVKGDLVPMTASEARQLHVTQASMEGAAPEAASAVLAGLKPEYVRDQNRVIQYAVIQSDNPLTASAVLAPDFANQFTETLGPDVIVAIPNRNKIFVFPKLSQGYQGLADLIVAEYESSPNPVSKEVFQLRGGKLIAIGSYR